MPFQKFAEDGEVSNTIHNPFERGGPGFLSLLERVPSSIAVISGADLRYSYLNESFSELLGGRAAEGLSMMESTPELLKNGLLEKIQSVRDDRREFTLQEQRIRLGPDGRSRYFHIVLQPLNPHADSSTDIIWFSNEITEQVQYRAAIRESEESFRTLVDNISQLAWIADKEGSIFWYNKRWFEYTGTTLPDMQGWGWKKVHHPDHVERVAKRIQHSWDTGEAWEDTFPLLGADGQYRWFLSRALPIRNEAGEIVRWFGTNTDITDQRDAARRKDEFIATLAHELRNPLAPIRTGLELIELYRDQPERVQEIRESMIRQTDQLVVLVDDLLDVSRLNRGKYQIRRKTSELQAIISDAIALCRPMLEQAGQSVSQNLPQKKIYVEADSHRLVQVFGNLLNNASKYSPDQSLIEVEAHLEGNDVVVVIRDEGAGIEPQMQDKIFEMFTQVDPPRRDGYGGLGIGLSLVQTLVGLHGGTVSVESRGLGFGSTFSVRLPAAKEPEAKTSNNTSFNGVAQTQVAKVLVVDDNTVAARFLSLMLEAAGHTVEVADDGLQGLKKAESYRPDIIFMDIGMPHLNGYEAAARIREKEWGRQMTLVAVSGWGRDADKARALSAGFDAHITKPASAAEVRRLVHTARTR